MKNWIFLLGVVAASAFADAPKTIHWGVEKAFVPVGFDDNDKVQVTVTGTFDSTCLKVGSYQYDIDESKKEIRIDQKAYQYHGICLQMTVPFNQVIDLGIVPAGEWALVDANSAKPLGTLKIGISKNEGPDDFLYAPVTDALVKEDATGKKELCLSGTFSDRCTKLKKVEVNYATNVIVVQPIAEHLVPQNGQEDGCEAVQLRYQHCEALPDGLLGLHLLHVRSMNGQAINKIVDLR